MYTYVLRMYMSGIRHFRLRPVSIRSYMTTYTARWTCMTLLGRVSGPLLELRCMDIGMFEQLYLHVPLHTCTQK